jgi:PAS domain S-box-containing protein
MGLRPEPSPKAIKQIKPTLPRKQKTLRRRKDLPPAPLSRSLIDLLLTFAQAVELQPQLDVATAASQVFYQLPGFERTSIQVFSSSKSSVFKPWAGISASARKILASYDPWSNHGDQSKTPAPKIVENIQNEPELAASKETLEKESIRAIASYPLLHQGHLIGALNLHLHRPYRFERESATAQILANVISLGITQKRAIRKLRKSRDALQAIFDVSPVGMAVLSMPDGRFVKTNSVFLRTSGYPSDELLSLTLKDITHPSDRKQMMEFFDQFKSGLPAHFPDRRFLRKDGSYFWASVSAAHFRKNLKEQSRSVIVIQDVTDRKLSEQTLQESLRKYQTLVDSVDGIVWEATPDFRFTFVSRQAERILGYTVEQWKSDPDFWANHVHPDDRNRVIDFCQSQTLAMQDHDFEYRMIAANGKIIWLRDLVHVIVENGQLTGLRGIMVDVSAQMKIAEELQKSISLLQATLNSTTDGILVVDLSGQIVSFNPKFLELWKLQENSLKDKDDGKLLHFVLNQLKEPDRFLLKVGELYQHPERESHDTLEFNDGRVFERYSRPQRIHDKIIGRVWSFRDITERILYARSREALLHQEIDARSQAERAVELRDDFLSIAAHELRTPLTPILLYLQMIQQTLETLELKDPKDPNLPKVEFLKKSIRGTNHEFDRFLNLVERLLDVSRLRAGKMVLERQPTDLSQLVAHAVRRFRPEFAKSQCPFQFISREPVWGNWDPNRIEQVVINLLSNAIKYGAKNPIEITVTKTQDKALLQVRDYGIGISKEDQFKLFHRFERAASIKNFSGFGLGLYISREIVKAHGGEIQLSSEPGKGSLFTVELPLSNITPRPTREK